MPHLQIGRVGFSIYNSWISNRFDCDPVEYKDHGPKDD